MAGQAEAACPPWGSRGLLAVAILSSCFLLTQAQEIPVKVDPSRPLQGRNVTLTPGGDPSFIQCNWYRGARADPNMIFLYAPAFIPPLVSNGPQFTGRETVGPDCSLHISNLTLNDTGIYSVSKTTRDGPQTGSVSMQVFEMLFSPILSPANSFVKEHTNITLNCYTFPSEGVFVFWFKNEESLPAKSILSERNRTLTLPDISRDDEGTYTCQAWNPANNATSNPSIIVVESTPPPEGPDSGLSAGAIVGIVIGCLVGVVLIVLVLYFALKSTTLGAKRTYNIPH